MKKALCIQILFIIFFGTAACAKPINIMTVTIVNHASQPIIFNVTKNPHIIPDLPLIFILKKQAQISTSVVSGPEGSDEGLIHGSGALFGKVFFGMSTASIYGYVGKNIAFSWNNVQDATITFCTPKEFKTDGYCK
jgi:hypothetical protein